MLFIIFFIIIIFSLSCYFYAKTGIDNDDNNNVIRAIMYISSLTTIIFLLFSARQTGVEYCKKHMIQQIPRDLLNGKIEYRINNTIENGNIIKSDTIYFYK